MPGSSESAFCEWLSFKELIAAYQKVSSEDCVDEHKLPELEINKNGLRGGYHDKCKVRKEEPLQYEQE